MLCNSLMYAVNLLTYLLLLTFFCVIGTPTSLLCAVDSKFKRCVEGDKVRFNWVQCDAEVLHKECVIVGRGTFVERHFTVH